MVKVLKLPDEVVEIINNPKTFKVVATKDEEGVPHVVFKGSLRAIDNETIAFAELLENSRTGKNILRLMNFDYDKKKLIAISVFNSENGISYQIKGEPYQLEVEGPIWDEFLKMIWKWNRDADPVGVWLVRPRELLNQTYNFRKQEEENRLQPPDSMWFKYLGPRE
jgi:hypothetical protein